MPEEPVYDRVSNMLISYFISVFIHILSAVAWFGATILVAVYLRRRSEVDAQLVETYRRIARVTLFLLFVTGLYNLFARGYGWVDLFDPVFWSGYFGETLMLKSATFVLILIVAGAGDRAIGKIISNRSVDTQVWMRRFVNFTWINLILGAIVLFCAVMLIRGRPW